MTVHRRTVLKGMLGAGVSAVALQAPVVHAQAPFKIGLLTVKTGPLAQGGIQMEQGIATFLKEKGNSLAGRKVELLVADTGGNPAGAKTKAQEVIERDRSMSSSARSRRSSCWRSPTTCATTRRRSSASPPPRTSPSARRTRSSFGRQRHRRRPAT